MVNGQKTWTTLAQDANWIFLLVRTDKAAKKQEGISFLLVPMDRPGVTVRPIINLDLHDEFCEVFFDNVRVPAREPGGRARQGLDHGEGAAGLRAHLPRLAAPVLERAGAAARSWRSGWGCDDDPVFADRYARLSLDLEDLKALYDTYVARCCGAASRSGPTSPC